NKMPHQKTRVLRWGLAAIRDGPHSKEHLGVGVISRGTAAVNGEPHRQEAFCSTGGTMSTGLVDGSALHIAPPLPNLVGRRGACGADLLNSDRRAQAAKGGRLFERCASRDGASDAGAGAVAGPDGVNGAGHRKGFDEVADFDNLS